MNASSITSQVESDKSNEGPESRMLWSYIRLDKGMCKDTGVSTVNLLHHDLVYGDMENVSYKTFSYNKKRFIQSVGYFK